MFILITRHISSMLKELPHYFFPTGRAKVFFVIFPPVKLKILLTTVLSRKAADMKSRLYFQKEVKIITVICISLQTRYRSR